MSSDKFGNTGILLTSGTLAWPSGDDVPAEAETGLHVTNDHEMEAQRGKSKHKAKTRVILRRLPSCTQQLDAILIRHRGIGSTGATRNQEGGEEEYMSGVENVAMSTVESTLRQLTTRYQRTAAHARLSVFAAAVTSVLDASGRKYTNQPIGDLDTGIIAIGLPNALSEDRWSIDARGVLMIAVGKETYERLGIVGRKSGKREREIYVIDIPLQADASKSKNRMEAALKAWDARREQEQSLDEAGSGTWDVVYWCEGAHRAHLETALGCDVVLHDVVPTVKTLRDVYVPGNELVRSVSRSGDGEDAAELFEWVGMACLGSQRLQVSDRVDPYVAVYTPPVPFLVADVVHFRWTGLLPATFVQRAIDVCSGADSGASFAAIAGNSMTDCVDAPQSLSAWTLILSATEKTAQQTERAWILAER